MAAISDGVGLRTSGPGFGGRVGSPAAPTGSGQRQSSPVPGAVEPARFGNLPKLFQAQAAGFAKAVRVRQNDRSLSRAAERAAEARVSLQLFKLYPPYPVDEPRRAQAIREFNGVAAEVKRLGVVRPDESGLGQLADSASTADVEGALGGLARASGAIETSRATLAKNGPSVDESRQAESDSVGVGLTLGEGLAIARRPDALLRQIG